MAARSYLYVPGDQPDKLAKAAGRGADALVLDLEDAVAPARKAEARGLVAEHLATAGTSSVERWVRVTTSGLEDDLAAVVGPSLAGVVLPKAEPALLERADALLVAAEQRLGLPEGAVRVVALVESALGVERAGELARHPRVDRLGVGEADLAADLGLVPGPEREELWPYRAMLVLASAVAGCGRPVGPVETSVRDLDLLERGTRRLLRQGFRARTALTPAQVEVVNRVLAPSSDEVADARAVLAALAAGGTSGVVLGPGGRVVDEAVVRSARDVLERAGES